MDTIETIDIAALLEKQPFDKDAIAALRDAAFESADSIDRLQELLAGKESASPDAATAYKLGVCWTLLANFDKAIPYLEKASSIPDHAVYLGMIRLEQRRFTDAAALFDKAAKAGIDRVECELRRAECLALHGDLAAAKQILTSHNAISATNATWHYIAGRIAEESGSLIPAMEAYEAALKIDDVHTLATFRLAYLLDLHGEEERARELYTRSCEEPFVFTNALMNLAIILEDACEFDAAASCLRRVLIVQPNHPRALLYMKDVQSSTDMYIDESQMRNREARDAVLDTPVSDFELSVRSRNCLKKMNIHTLGDLLRITEHELLAYKNFGETSLREIKAMLNQKGLSMGQNAHLKAVPRPSPMLSAPPASAAPLGNTDILSRSVSTINFSVRSRKCLQRLGINTIGELISKSEQELLESRNFGSTSLTEIKEKLTELGIALRGS
ncbi:MAG: DNA-directed RNA polymerase subunit alpha C-terminal domain-containing protein [Planctomycetota bacterium]